MPLAAGRRRAPLTAPAIRSCCIDTIIHLGLPRAPTGRTGMYSQQELDDAVAAGAITAEAADALRAHVERQRSTRDSGRRAVPADHRLQRHLRLDRRRDPAVRGRLDRPVASASRPGLIDRRRRARRFLAPLFVAATAWGLALFFTAKRRMALPSILLLLAFVGGVLATAGFALVLGHRRRTAQRQQPAARRRSSRGVGAPSPPAPPGSTGAASTCRSPSPRAPLRSPAIARRPGRIAALGQNAESAQEPDPRLRAAARHRHVPVRHVVGLVGPRARSPAAPTSPSGCTCSRRR